jgi:tetratricopeptide (TPR) repeat protein
MVNIAQFLGYLINNRILKSGLMKKQSYRGLAAIALVGAMLTGCKLIGDVEYTVQQDPVQMHGDSVKVSVTVKFPEKGLKKKASAEITPKLGDASFKTITVQGEKATGNGQTIAYKPGGTVNYTDVLPYNSSMENADLMVTGEVKKGKKVVPLDPEKIADGTIITPYLVMNDDKALIGKDNFVRTTEETFSGTQFNYLKGKSDVRSTELKDKDIPAFQAWMADAQVNPKKKVKSINFVSYASPEGEVAKNSELANDRAKSGKASVEKILTQAKFTQVVTMNEQPKGEDWDGFKKAVDASTLKDKELIVRVLQMYTDPVKREEEIKNMGKTYTDLEKEILPSLRRTQINVVYDKIGWSDDELKSLSTSKPDTLTIEEILFTATLYTDLNEKMRLYKLATTRFPEDWRGWNNVGYVYYMQNDLANAKTNWEKANSIKENPVTLNNLGIVARVQDKDRAKATKMYTSAVSAGSEVKYNLGIIDIQNGNYAQAIGNMGSNNTFNKALAQLLNGDYDAAKTTIDASPDKDSAMGYYLKAIIGARKNDLTYLTENLTKAIAKDSSLKAKAAKDREFIKFFENASFKAIVG